MIFIISQRNLRILPLPRLGWHALSPPPPPCKSSSRSGPCPPSAVGRCGGRSGYRRYSRCCSPSRSGRASRCASGCCAPSSPRGISASPLTPASSPWVSRQARCPTSCHMDRRTPQRDRISVRQPSGPNRAPPRRGECSSPWTWVVGSPGWNSWRAPIFRSSPRMCLRSASLRGFLIILCMSDI